jgi:hypothetical protein
LICAVLANIHRDPKKSKTYQPQDFLPGRKKTPDEMLNEAMKISHFEVKDG